MFPFIIFAIAVLGLAVLFFCKSLELSRNARTPLVPLRRRGDRLVMTGWSKCRTLCRDYARLSMSVSAHSAHKARRQYDAVLDATVQKVAARLNQYLRGRRTLIRGRTEDVSAHLKTVLEKTEKNTTETDST